MKLSPKVPNSENSMLFHQGMINRMEASYHKYGPLAAAYPHKVDAIKSLNTRLKKYQETGNTEWLMDVANFAMIEFMHPSHPQAHYKATDTAESPGRTLTSGETTRRPNTEIGES